MGPLAGLRIVEIAGIGPGPLAAMLLSDLGAEVIRIDRLHPGAPVLDIEPHRDVVLRGRRSIMVDLKQPGGLAVLLALVDKADGLIEGFRPGVAERMGFGPAVCLARNPGLVFGRMTGYGQTGPLAQSAGHDINYIAQVGALHAIGRAGERPVPPLNLVGDYGGGAMLLAFGMVCALLERARSGLGQVVDAAMIDGAATLMAPFFGLLAAGAWADQRGVNLLDGGCPFYDTYPTRDGRFMAVGALEPKFFAELIARLGLDPSLAGRQYDRTAWPHIRAALGAMFLTRDFDAWCAMLEQTDCCTTGVRSLAEAPHTAHSQARGAFATMDGVAQPAPAPRFGRSAAGPPAPPEPPGRHTDAVLAELGHTPAAIAALRQAGIVA